MGFIILVSSAAIAIYWMFHSKLTSKELSDAVFELSVPRGNAVDPCKPKLKLQHTLTRRSLTKALSLHLSRHSPVWTSAAPMDDQAQLSSMGPGPYLAQVDEYANLEHGSHSSESKAHRSGQEVQPGEALPQETLWAVYDADLAASTVEQTLDVVHLVRRLLWVEGWVRLLCQSLTTDETRAARHGLYLLASRGATTDASASTKGNSTKESLNFKQESQNNQVEIPEIEQGPKSAAGPRDMDPTDLTPKPHFESESLSTTLGQEFLTFLAARIRAENINNPNS